MTLVLIDAFFASLLKIVITLIGVTSWVLEYRGERLEKNELFSCAYLKRLQFSTKGERFFNFGGKKNCKLRVQSAYCICYQSTISVFKSLKSNLFSRSLWPKSVDASITFSTSVAPSRAEAQAWIAGQALC